MTERPWWQRLIQSFSAANEPGVSNQPPDSDQPSQLDAETLKKMVEGIFSTRPDELSCGECFDQVDQFAEMTLAGKNAAEAMPLVQDHLDRCRDCREEFGALLDALRAMG